MKESILAYLDFNKIFKLYINALDIRLKVVFMQKDKNSRDWVICYEAKILLLVKMMPKLFENDTIKLQLMAQLNLLIA